MIRYFQGYKIQDYKPFNFGEEELATIKIVVPRKHISDNQNITAPSFEEEIENEKKAIDDSKEQSESEISPGHSWGERIDEDLDEESLGIEIEALSDDDFKATFGDSTDNHRKKNLELPSSNIGIPKTFLIATHARKSNEIIELGEFGGSDSNDLIETLQFDSKIIQLVLDGKQKTHKGYTFKIEER